MGGRKKSAAWFSGKRRKFVGGNATLRVVVESAVALAVTIVVGFVRPRWSTLSVALIPTLSALAWLLMHEDIPGDETTLSDVAWYVVMSLMVGAAFALACLLGVVARRAVGRGRITTLS